MRTPPTTMQFNILTSVKGLSEAEQQIVNFHADAATALQSIQQYWVNYAQQVGLSTRQTAKQLDQLREAIDLVNRTLAFTAATGVTVDTGDLRIAARDMQKIHPIAEQLVSDLRSMAQKYPGATFPQQLQQDVTLLTSSFVAANPSLSKINKLLDDFIDNLGKTNPNLTNLRNLISQLGDAAEDAAPKADPNIFQFKIKDLSPWQKLKNFFEGIRRPIQGMAGSIIIAHRVMSDLKNTTEAVAKAIYSVTLEAAKMRDATAAFTRLTGSAIDAEEILSRVYVAGGGAIERMQLVGAATRAALAGLPVERFDELVRGARALAAATGRDVSDALERLTNSIAKQERRLLDELGIVVRANELYKEYAEKHNRVATALTGSERALAFFEGVMDRVNEKVLTLGGNVDQAQRPFMQFQSAARNLRVTFGEWLSQVLDVPGILVGLSGEMDALAQSFQSTSQRSAEAMANFNAATKAVANFEETIPGLIKEAEYLSSVMQSNTATTREKEAADKRLKAVTDTLIGVFPELADILRSDLTAGLVAATNATKAQLEVQRALASIQLREVIEANDEAWKEASKTVAETSKNLKDLNATAEAVAGTDEELTEISFELARSLGLVSRANMIGSEGMNTYQISLEELNDRITAQRKNLLAAEDAMTVMNGRIARYVKNLVELNKVQEDTVTAFIKAQPATADYNATLETLSKAVGESKEHLDAAREALILLFSEPKSDKPIQSAEDLLARLKDLRKEWKELRDVSAVVDIDTSPVEQAEIKLNSLQAEQRDLIFAVADGIGEEANITEDTVNEIISAYNKYAQQRIRVSQMVGKQEDESVRSMLNRTRAALDEKIAETGLSSDEIVKILADTDREVYEASVALDKARADEYISNARDRLTSEKEVARDAVEEAKRQYGIWSNLLNKLGSENLLSAKRREMVERELGKAFQKIAEEEEKTYVDMQKTKMDTTLDTLKTLTSVISSFAGMQEDDATRIIDDLERVSDESPPQLQSMVNTIKQMFANMGTEISAIEKQVVDNFTDQLAIRFAEFEDEVDAEAKAHAGLADYKDKVEEARTDFYIKNLGRQRAAAIRFQKLGQYMEAEMLNLSQATTKKQLDDKLLAIQQHIDANKSLVDNQQALDNFMLAAETVYQSKLGSLQLNSTENTLAKIALATKFAAVKKIEDELELEEYSAEQIEMIRTALAAKLREILNLENHDLESAVAKRYSIEKAAAVERERAKGAELDADLQRQIENLKSIKATQTEIDRIENLRVQNSKFTAERIAGIEERMDREARLNVLKFRKKTSETMLEMDELSIEIEFSNLSASLENQKLYWLTKVGLARDGTQEQIAALQALEKIDAQLAEVAKMRADGLAQVKIEADRRAFEERKKMFKQLVDFIDAGTLLANEIERKALEVETSYRLEQLEAWRTAEEDAILKSGALNAERVQNLLELDDLVSKMRLAILQSYKQRAFALESAIWKQKIDTALFGSIQMKDAIQGSLASISEVVEDDVTKTIEAISTGYENASSAIATTIAAAATPSPGTIAVAAASWINFTAKLIGFAKDREKALRKKYEEEILEALDESKSLAEMKALKRSVDMAKLSAEQRKKIEEEFIDTIDGEMQDLAGKIADDMASAILEGLDVPFDVLIANFVKAQAAEEIAGVIRGTLADELGTVKEEVGLLLDPTKRLNELSAEFDRQKDAEIAHRRNILQTQIVSLEEDRDYWQSQQNMAFQSRNVAAANEAAANLKATNAQIAAAKQQLVNANQLSTQDQEAIYAKSQQVYAEKHGAETIGKAFSDMEKDWLSVEPDLRGAVDGLDEFMTGFDQDMGLLGDKASQLQEQIPAATFRAVTEPQANQLILLAGRQTDYLAVIASNTAELVRKQEKVNIVGNQVINAEPAAMQDININERLDITINGKAIMSVEKAEDFDVYALANRLSIYQQKLIDNREVALGRSKQRQRRLR